MKRIALVAVAAIAVIGSTALAGMSINDVIVPEQSGGAAGREDAGTPAQTGVAAGDGGAMETVRYEFEGLTAQPDGGDAVTFEPVSLTGGWLYELSGGGPVSVTLGSITDGAGFNFNERYIEISGANGSVRLLKNSFSYDGTYKKTQFWSAKQWDGDAIVKDFSSPEDIRTAVLFTFPDGGDRIMGYTESEGVDFWSLTPPEDNYCAVPVPLGRQRITQRETQEIEPAIKDGILAIHPERTDDVEIYEITPEDIRNLTGCRLLKTTGGACWETYIVRGEEIYHIGTGFGGNGVTSAVARDINGDGVTDIAYAHSSGSGLHRAAISWFDLSTCVERPALDVSGEPYVRLGYDLMLKAEDGGISAYRITGYKDNAFILEGLSVYTTLWDTENMILEWDGAVTFDE